ncbi:DUF1634 domain-containing protein [Aerosakkonemataceae cyanobacterium BLCC-F50]|uniref:DUF1634 domain-containing protein n=1 Tax=Floridaenema flaviceps BLCC-F50 TaxID=3153642 RepID=A0ABV4XS93_9CYAN
MQKLAENETVGFNLLQEDLDRGINEFTHKCEIDEEIKYSKAKREQQLGLLLSNLLKYGVFLASAVVLVGGILYLIRHGTEPADYRVFHGVPSEFRSPEGVINAVLAGRRRGIIQLGLLILIATPIVRVAISFLAFLRQRDYVYIVVTLLVLSGLIYSLIGAYH